MSNNKVTCGIDLAVKRFQTYIDHQVQQKNTVRTSNDGLRAGYILLDNQYRGSVAGIMTKKKDRCKSDVMGDPTTHFFDKIVQECFLNRDYIVSPPSDRYYREFPEDEKGSWDPNHQSILDHKRDGAWMCTTWEEYVCPKYKKALDKWNKDTGGGDGSPTAFIDFCGSDRWLVWLFCKDMECNFLLACSAGGRMPRHLQIESGFTEEMSMSSLGDDSSNKIESQVAAVTTDRKHIAAALKRSAWRVPQG